MMNHVTVTPSLIQELQRFEEKKHVYMVEADQQQDKDKEEKHPKIFKYFFQHPYLRLLTTSTNYPPNAMSILKVFLWLFAILFGAVVGKVVIHYWLFCSQIQLKLFSKEGHGSWCITFLFTICVLFYQSTVYNAFLTLCGSEWDEYRCSSNLHIEYTTFIKGLAVTTWLGDAFMCWMVFDMMLQEKRYPYWMKEARSSWKDSDLRIALFWLLWVTFSVVFVTGITVGFFHWTDMNQHFVSTDELSRAHLASIIIVLNLIIIMQDWDFPHFSGVTDVKPPGIPTKGISVKIPARCSVLKDEVHVEGKWFNYSVLFIILVFNLYQMKNQIYYQPDNYGQYTDSNGYIYTITNRTYLSQNGNNSILYVKRLNSATNDYFSASRYLSYSSTTKGTAFLPVVAMFLIFAYCSYKSAQQESEGEKMIRRWYESKFARRRTKRRVTPMVKQEDSATEDETEDNSEEMLVIERNNSKKFNFYFQHPATRLLSAYTVVFLSCLVIAEDPVAYSLKDTELAVLGNVYMLIFGRYPPKPEYATLKVCVWLCGLVSGLWVGKFVVYDLTLNSCCKFKLFRKGQGSWTVTSITVIIILYAWTLAFNKIAELDPELTDYIITNQMNLSYTTFMKGVALASFLSHFIFAVMVTDTILQEKHYPSWAQMLRRIWKRQCVRMPVIWTITAGTTILAIVVITTECISYKSISSSPTNELGRACLAASVLVIDIFVLTQDWEFPRFKPNQSIKLPGLTVSEYNFKLCWMNFSFKGKWFTYGLIGIILIIDTYVYKNQLVYNPSLFGQDINKECYIVSPIAMERKVLPRNSTVVFGINNYINNYTTLTTTDTQTKVLDAQFLGYNEETKYSVSLLLILLTLMFSIWFGVRQSIELSQVERACKEKRLAMVIPRVEDMTLKKNTLKLRGIGNQRR